jgi:hypothetical protein
MGTSLWITWVTVTPGGGGGGTSFFAHPAQVKSAARKVENNVVRISTVEVLVDCTGNV